MERWIKIFQIFDFVSKKLKSETTDRRHRRRRRRRRCFLLLLFFCGIKFIFISQKLSFYFTSGSENFYYSF